ncbi:hypothetical protein DMH04_06635 [Kibdelosporangium aridum]|uniref:Prenyltransferase n=1 Tax=Kibdelosporangium aridum TaxID=2030 RepID=A0A428ZP33_KIBAR|nr:hypothetical protein DMH04_06635 [Kibdelosporangium aridum]
MDWLLGSPDPAVRLLVERDLFGVATGPINSGPRIGALLSGGLDCHPYTKWTGAHWRLVSLTELGFTGPTPLADHVLAWVTRLEPVVIDGLVRRHTSQEGNALAACVQLGMARDPRVRGLAESLIDWQWPDGGWNCDPKASGRRSSFHETLPALHGLYTYSVATGDRRARGAADRAAELLLEHRLFRSSAGDVINKAWLALHYPPYWHYDILQALLVLSRMGKGNDPRTAEALDVLRRRQRRDGCWQPGGYWWKATGPYHREVVDWGRSGPNEMITLNALRVLSRCGQLDDVDLPPGKDVRGTG